MCIVAEGAEFLRVVPYFDSGLSGNFSHSQCPLSCVYQKVVQMSISTVPRHRKCLFKQTFHVHYDLTRKVCIVHK